MNYPLVAFNESPGLKSSNYQYSITIFGGEIVKFPRIIKKTHTLIMVYVPLSQTQRSGVELERSCNRFFSNFMTPHFVLRCDNRWKLDIIDMDDLTFFHTCNTNKLICSHSTNKLTENITNFDNKQLGLFLLKNAGKQAKF